MEPARIFTLVIAAAAVLLTTGLAWRMTGSALAAVLVVGALAAKLPWATPHPVPAEALGLLACVMVLAGWLDAQGEGRLERGFTVVVAATLLEPEMVLLALGAVIVECLRRRGDFGVKRALAAAGIVAGAALASIMFQKWAISPAAALSCPLGRVVAGTAWEASDWVFAGSGASNIRELAGSYDIYFYWPLVVVFLALSLRYRRCWWYAPLFGWSALVALVTLWLVETPALSACPPLEAALIVPFGVVGALELRALLRQALEARRPGKCR